MKRLTDEQVAKALGWKSLATSRAKDYLDCYWQRTPALLKRGKVSGTDEHFGPPRYTTSLDAIVAEIEARGLGYELHVSVIKDGLGPGAVVWPKGTNENIKGAFHYAKSAPLALCAALMVYLKETKP